jgi:predicted S18 family serine protease
MRRLRRALISFAVVAAAAGAACTDPPDKEMQQAQGAIDAARAAGADQYARDEFTAAEDALKRARDAVDQRDYRQALNNALDARERAQTAAKDTVNKKATARVDAEKAIADATAALDESRGKLKAAEAGRGALKSVAAANRSVGEHERRLQEARTAFDRGDYLAAIEQARSAAADLRATTRDLDTAATTGTRRHR